MALFESETRSATITASEDCLVFEVKRRDFDALCERHPKLGYKLVKKIAAVLCERVRKGNQDILKLSTALSIALSRT
jgi:CRP-like cAMP-binding protein